MINPLHSDSELILLWKDGNEQAFELLYKKHVTVLITLARQKLADKELAEDFVHDAFISFYKRKEDLPADISISAYLYVSLRNRIFSYYRKDSLGQKYITHITHIHTDTDNSTVEQIEAKEFEERINKEIKKLPPQCKIVFELSRKEHLSNKEIGQKLDLSENTIEQHIRRALRQLKNSFKDYFKN